MPLKDKNMQTAQDVVNGGWKDGDDFEIGFVSVAPAGNGGGKTETKPQPKTK
jgi:hypothetical protein